MHKQVENQDEQKTCLPTAEEFDNLLENDAVLAESNTDTNYTLYQKYSRSSW